MATVADADLQYVLRSERIEVYKPVEGDLLARRIKPHSGEKPPINFGIKLFTELVVGNTAFPVVAHGMAFPPITIGVLPAPLFVRTRRKRSRLAETLGQFFEFLHELRHRCPLACTNLGSLSFSMPSGRNNSFSDLERASSEN